MGVEHEIELISSFHSFFSIFSTRLKLFVYNLLCYPFLFKQNVSYFTKNGKESKCKLVLICEES